MSSRTPQEGRKREAVKQVGISGEESRRQREESANEIRKSKKDAFLQAKRRKDDAPEANTHKTERDSHMDHTNGELMNGVNNNNVPQGILHFYLLL
jgi:hypothetical protein